MTPHQSGCDCSHVSDSNVYAMLLTKVVMEINHKILDQILTYTYLAIYMCT